MITLEFKVPGNPAGKQVRNLPNGVPVTSSSARRYIKAVSAAAESAKLRENWQPPDRQCPVTVIVHAFFQIPKSWPKYKREAITGWPCWKAPDFDNILKAVSDALQGKKTGPRAYAGTVVVEDSAISGACWKWWTEGEPYTQIAVSYSEDHQKEVTRWTQSQGK